MHVYTQVRTSCFDVDATPDRASLCLWDYVVCLVARRAGVLAVHHVLNLTLTFDSFPRNLPGDTVSPVPAPRCTTYRPRMVEDAYGHNFARVMRFAKERPWPWQISPGTSQLFFDCQSKSGRAHPGIIDRGKDSRILGFLSRGANWQKKG